MVEWSGMELVVWLCPSIDCSSIVKYLQFGNCLSGVIEESILLKGISPSIVRSVRLDEKKIEIQLQHNKKRLKRVIWCLQLANPTTKMAASILSMPHQKQSTIECWQVYFPFKPNWSSAFRNFTIFRHRDVRIFQIYFLLLKCTLHFSIENCLYLNLSLCVGLFKCIRLQILLDLYLPCLSICVCFIRFVVFCWISNYKFPRVKF